MCPPQHPLLMPPIGLPPPRPARSQLAGFFFSFLYLKKARSYLFCLWSQLDFIPPPLWKHYQVYLILSREYSFSLLLHLHCVKPSYRKNLFVSPVANSNAAEFLKLHFMFPLDAYWSILQTKLENILTSLISNSSILIPILGRAWAQGKEKQGEKVWMLLISS